MKTNIYTNLKSFLELLDKVHFCEKGGRFTGKFSFKNEFRILYCEYCELAIDSCSLRIYSDSSDSVLQFEEIICIDENFERTDKIVNFPQINDIEDIYVDVSDTLPLSPFSDEKDPLSIDNALSEAQDKCLNSSDTARIMPKIVNWTSDSIGTYSESLNNKKQKYPITLVCEYCGLTFQGKDRIYKLFYHRNKIHTKNIKFKCSVCQRVYWGEREFSLHVATHSSSGSICEVCGIQFSRKQDLKRHFLIHNSEQFLCIYCSKKFNRKDNLKVHERLHTGHFPFICLMCSSGFPQKHQLTLHKRKCPFLKSVKLA